jgi:stage II sporulation protein D
MIDNAHDNHARRRRRRARGPLAWVTAVLVALGGGVFTATPAQGADVPKEFVLHGSGFGHGVGMPQYGAYQMSREGTAGRGILEYYYPGTSVDYRTTPRTTLVQVYGPDPYSSPSMGDTRGTTKVTVRGGDWRLRGADGTTLARGSGTTTLTVATTKKGRAKVTVDGESYYGKPLRIHWSGTRYFKRDGARAVASVEGAQGTYRHGRLTVAARDGIPNITNDVLLNTEYLYGIAEMPSSWGLNGGRGALSAQAITARSYAMTKSFKSSCRCHVVDDIRDQNYTGWKKESEGADGRYGKVWKRSVDATVRGPREARVLTYGGDPVAAYYYSSGGARTANSQDVWASAVPYLKSVDDSYSLDAPGNSHTSWTRKITQAEARELFGLKNVKSIWVTSRWPSGQVRTVTATSPSGNEKTITGKADRMRTVLGRATTDGSMPASWITKIRRNW